MLELQIPPREYWDESNETFVVVEGQTLKLEHSLVSLSKWESKWHKPFLGKDDDRTYEETIDYIKCMTLTQNVDDRVYKYLSTSAIDAVNDYISNPMTATVIKDMNNKKGGNGEFITSELIYYWMIALQIPFECQKWHLNRLMTLIQVCNIKNAPEKKMSKRDILNQNRSLNAARRAKAHSKG